MQTIIQVFSKAAKSLRTQVVNDQHLHQFGLIVSERRKKGRPKGWAKLCMDGSDGVINIEWHAASQMLICGL
jgi:hypothetical protein